MRPPNTNLPPLDEFTQGYVESALTTLTKDGVPLNYYFSVTDVNPTSLRRAIQDCTTFQTQVAELLEGADLGAAGFEFWDSRNGEEAFLWGDYPPEVAVELQEQAMTYGRVRASVGVDRKVRIG
jgi:hypothetical protein